MRRANRATASLSWVRCCGQVCAALVDHRPGLIIFRPPPGAPENSPYYALHLSNSLQITHVLANLDPHPPSVVDPEPDLAKTGLNLTGTAPNGSKRTQICRLGPTMVNFGPELQPSSGQSSVERDAELVASGPSSTATRPTSVQLVANLTQSARGLYNFDQGWPRVDQFRESPTRFGQSFAKFGPWRGAVPDESGLILANFGLHPENKPGPVPAW